MPRVANAHKVTTKPEKPVRPTRVPVGGYRDVLEVYGKDPDYRYRWVCDSSENGGRIATFKMGGYDFANGEEHNVPKQHTFSPTSEGSIVRLPCRNGDFLYLMRIPNHLAEEDDLRKEQEIAEIEQQIMSPNNTGEDLGQYQSTAKIETGFRSE